MGSIRQIRWLLAAACVTSVSALASHAQTTAFYGDLSQVPGSAPGLVPAGAAALGGVLGGSKPQPLFATDIPALNRIVWPPHFSHGDPDDPARHVGIGHPLAGTSWRNRPFHAGWLVGSLFGDSLIPGALDQGDNVFGGYRLGWDFDHYWGTEVRFGAAHLGIMDAQQASTGRSAHNQFWDLSLAYYPWGDAHWRPFASVGIGTRKIRFSDNNAQLVDDFTFSMPISAGVKYYYRPWMALRMSLVDNWNVRSQSLDSMHNFSLTAGVEMHFGGRRRSYFPYHPGGTLW